ncbi:MAG TPA: NADP-dependent oxidoreductase [Haliangiales bacterium]|nr:NADP-dependent oxidoreductase [Haliangiales bacterium]
MRALVIHRYGGPEVISLEDRPEPTAGPHDVVVAVRAAALNPLDVKLRAGKVKLVIKLRFPATLGCDVAGVVRAVGADVTRFRAGDEVFARLEKARMGGLAEVVAADEKVVALRPRSVSFEEAASLPLSGLTALQALRDVAQLRPGQRVLVHAGAGGVGSLAIQIAKILGLHVTTTASGRNAALVRGLGADDVIDYTTEDVTARARGVDAVFDTLGGASEARSLGLVRPGGVVVGVAGLPDAEFARAALPWWARAGLWLATLRRRRAAARAGARFAFLFMRADGAELAEIAAWVDAGRLRPVIHKTYALADVAAAFAELERGHARGKIVIKIP